MKKAFISFVLLAFLVTGFFSDGLKESTDNSQKQTLTVLAAASLTESFTEIGKKFEEENPDIRVTFNFAGSQTLFQQLEQGIPADVFASANQKYMSDAISNGFVEAPESKNFSKNALIVIYPKSNPGNIKVLADLSNPSLKIVIAAEEVPVGKYTLEFLDKTDHTSSNLPAEFKERFLQNVVSYENTVKSVVSKVLLGEADAGVVYLTDVTGDSINELAMIEIPSDLNVIATYPIAALKSSKNLALAQAFVNYVLSEDGQNILQDYGFINP
jgi:molybdate transport system substrate-binding protein